MCKKTVCRRRAGGVVVTMLSLLWMQFLLTSNVYVNLKLSVKALSTRQKAHSHSVFAAKAIRDYDFLSKISPL
ncbi:hypothetical protein VHEMI01720 [[Torrubiella] hemipterigena]|uniref:Uncharacterized protein n=1 Tax=[Torrubiella] hemipterigena TaxID=1531966 RepID=A0A0A1T668_9HYPO|nr:hypothetical protein VHEMI01720 [[Torrubiella] hemipterigena]